MPTLCFATRATSSKSRRPQMSLSLSARRVPWTRRISCSNDPTQTITSFVCPVALAGKTVGEVGQVFTSNGVDQIPYWSDKGSVSVPNLTLDTLTLGTNGNGFDPPIQGSIDAPAGSYIPQLSIGTVNTPEIIIGNPNNILQINSILQDSTGAQGSDGQVLSTQGGLTIWANSSGGSSNLTQTTLTLGVAGLSGRGGYAPQDGIIDTAQGNLNPNLILGSSAPLVQIASASTQITSTFLDSTGASGSDSQVLSAYNGALVWSNAGGVANLTNNTLTLGTNSQGLNLPTEGVIDCPIPNFGDNVASLSIGQTNSNGLFMGRAGTSTQVSGIFLDSTGSQGIASSSLLLCGADSELVWDDTTYLKTATAQQTYVPFQAIPNNLFTGLYNSLGLRPYGNYQQEDVVWSNLPTPSSWRSDITTAPPVSGGNANGWRFQRTATSGAYIQWSMYNPTYGQSALPLTLDFPPIPKSSLQSAWFIVHTDIALTAQYTLYMAMYTYDFSSPPASPLFYTTRHTYHLNTQDLPDSTTNFATKGQFQYLFYCCDSNPMLANPANPNTITVGNGQPSQRSMRLGDPFNIKTDIPHIKMNAVSYATNTPYTASTAPDLPIIGINIE